METVIQMIGKSAEMMIVPTDSRTTVVEVVTGEEAAEDVVIVTIVDPAITTKRDLKTTVSSMRGPKLKKRLPPQNPTIRSVLARMMQVRLLLLKRLM